MLACSGLRDLGGDGLVSRLVDFGGTTYGVPSAGVMIEGNDRLKSAPPVPWSTTTILTL